MPKTATPHCKGCIYMLQGSRAKLNGNNSHHGGPRASCYCTHPRHRETFARVCPKSNRMPGFIAYTPCGKNGPDIKTSPRWCPQRHTNFCLSDFVQKNEKEG